MSDLHNPLSGQMIRGYSLDRLLGRGTLTAVYHGRTQESWQLPELIITLLQMPEAMSVAGRSAFMERFTREAKRLITLRHPHLLPLYGYGEHAHYPYLLTPNAQGQVLAVQVRNRQRWSPTQVLAIITPLAMVFDYLHGQGYGYHYFQPANVLIQPDATVLLTGTRLMHILSALPADANRAAAPYAHLQSIAGTYLGAAEYLAPEVVRGENIDHRADIYSLGILLFELLTGYPPFTGDDYLTTALKHIREPLPSLHERSPELPVAMEIVINKALHRNPERRYQRASEFVHAYAQLLNDFQNTPKHLTLRRTVEQIRALPSPSPEIKLMLPSPNGARQASWPYSLLPDIQQHKLPPGITQQATEGLIAQIQERSAASEPGDDTQDQALPAPKTHTFPSYPLPENADNNVDGSESRDAHVPGDGEQTIDEVVNEGREQIEDTDPSLSAITVPQADQLANPFIDDSEEQDSDYTTIAETDQEESSQEEEPVDREAEEAQEDTMRSSATGTDDITPTKRKEIDKMTHELRSKRENLQNRAQEYVQNS